MSEVGLLDKAANSSVIASPTSLANILPEESLPKNSPKLDQPGIIKDAYFPDRAQTIPISSHFDNGLNPKSLEFFERNLPYDLLEQVIPQAREWRGQLFRQLENQDVDLRLASIVKQMDRFTRPLLENVVTRSAWNDLGPTIGTQVLELAVNLLKLDEMRRLSGVRQMHAAYTSVYKDLLSHNRLEHSLEVGFNAARMAKKMGLPRNTVMAIAAAGLLHDVGHPPFSHTGERIVAELIGESSALARLGCGEAFDHERYGQSLIRGKAISAVLGKHAITSAQVVGVLQNDHPFHAVIDWEDRLSYLARDLFGATVGYAGHSGELKAKRFRVVDAIEKFRSNVKEYKGQFVFDGDPRSTAKLLNLRLELLNEVSLTPEVLLVNGLLRREINNYVRRSKIDINDFLKLSDLSVIEKMAPRVRQILSNGVDQSYDMVNIFYRKEMTPRGIEAVSDARFAETLVQAVAPHLNPETQSNILIAACSEGSKQAHVKYLMRLPNGQASVETRLHESNVLPWCQSISVFAHKEAGARAMGDLSQRVESYFVESGFLMSKADQLIHYPKSPYQRGGVQSAFRAAQ